MKTSWQELPKYSFTCNCGITITGNTENGLIGLMKLHLSKGKFHLAWAKNSKATTDPLMIEMLVGFHSEQS